MIVRTQNSRIVKHECKLQAMWKTFDLIRFYVLLKDMKLQFLSDLKKCIYECLFDSKQIAEKLLYVSGNFN